MAKGGHTKVLQTYRGYIKIICQLLITEFDKKHIFFLLHFPHD